MRTRSPSDRIFNTAMYTVLAFACAATLYPFLTIIAQAFSGNIANMRGAVTIIPVDAQVRTFMFVVGSPKYLRALGVTVTVTAVGTALGLTLTTLAAYPLSRKYFAARKGLTIAYVFTMLFHPGLIPMYLLIRTLGMLNTLWALIFPPALSVYNMLIVKSFFETTPAALEDAARIDGAGHFTVFTRIMLPMVVPTLATIGLFAAVGYWNNYLNALFFITRSELQPLQIHLRNVIADALAPESQLEADLSRIHSVQGVRAATILASVLPILVVYPYLQKFFVKGIRIGSVKG
jgi:putative aldouronate transport system permease protein